MQPTSFIFLWNVEASLGEQCFLARFRRFCCKFDQSHNAKALWKKREKNLLVYVGLGEFLKKFEFEFLFEVLINFDAKLLR